jgi:hypothetical protein
MFRLRLLASPPTVGKAHGKRSVLAEGRGTLHASGWGPLGWDRSE